MYQTRLYTYPEGARNYTEISLETLENEFNLLSQKTYKNISEILDIYTFIYRKEVMQEIRSYGHYLTARNDMFLVIVKE